MFAPGYACNGIALELFAVCSTLISHDTSRAALRQRYVGVRETGTGSISIFPFRNGRCVSLHTLAKDLPTSA